VRRLFFFTCCLLLVTSLQAADETLLKFLEPPQVARQGDQRRLVFTLSKSGDVEVAVLDAQGTVVRHLAAGVLGGANPPPSPLQPGLKQDLVWDGKDDDGAPAKGGPFVFRLRAGTTVAFGKILGNSPHTGQIVTMPYRAPVNGIVTDEQGRIYVWMMSAVGSHGNSGMWPWHLRLFDEQGKYVQTLLPYPPSTKPEHAHGFRLLDTPRRFTPALSTSLYPVFAVLGNELVPRIVDRQLVFVHTESRTLNYFALDGSNRIRSVKMWPAAAKLNCPTWLDIQVAFSPDGKVAYYSNVAGVPYDGKDPGQIDPDWPQGRVYRHDLTREDAVPEPFFDVALPDFSTNKYWMPSAWDKKTALAGIDVDAHGNVFVCDLVNHQLVEIGPDGKQRSATNIDWPDRVMVSRKSGDLYVVTRKVSRGETPAGKLVKIRGRGEQAQVIAELPLAGSIGGAYNLDEHGPVPVIWLGGSTKEASKLWRIEDRGETLVVTGDDLLNPDPDKIDFVGYLDVDAEAELVYVTGSRKSVWRFHGETGEGGLIPIQAVDLAIGPRGDVYTWGTGGWEGPIARYDRELNPKPLATTGTHMFGHVSGRAGRGQSVCGLDVDRRGHVFAAFGSNDVHVRVYDQNGELVDSPRKQRDFIESGKREVPAAITGAVGYGGSIRVDAAGNIYLLQQGISPDHPIPAGHEQDDAYRSGVGTIYKFPPTGGEVRSVNHTVKEVIGATATYAGCGPISRWNAVGACACTRPRFDVDRFGRLYLPNALTFSVSVRDNADNEILRCGEYGNFDCQGDKSRQPAPAIPLGWPVGVGASDKYIYVGDALNHRVVRLDKHYQLEARIPADKSRQLMRATSRMFFASESP